MPQTSRWTGLVSLRLGLFVLCSLLAVLASCRSDSPKERTTPQEEITETLPAVTKHPALRHSVRVPENAEVLIGLRLAPLSRSAIVSRAFDKYAERKPVAASQLRKLASTCATKMDDDVDWDALVAVIPTPQNSQSYLARITSGLSKDRLIGCIQSFVQESEGELKKVLFNDKLLYEYVPAPQTAATQPEGVWFAPDGEHAVLLASTRELLQSVFGDAPKLTEMTGLGPLCSRVAKDASIWLVADLRGNLNAALPDEVLQAAAGKLGRPKEVVAQATLGAGVNLEVGLAFDTAREAEALRDKARSDLQVAALALQDHGLGRSLQQIRLETDSEWTSLKWEIDAPTLAKWMMANGAGSSYGVDNQPTTDQNPAP